MSLTKETLAQNPLTKPLLLDTYSPKKHYLSLMKKLPLFELEDFCNNLREIYKKLESQNDSILRINMDQLLDGNFLFLKSLKPTLSLPTRGHQIAP